MEFLLQLDGAINLNHVFTEGFYRNIFNMFLYQLDIFFPRERKHDYGV